MTLKDTEKIMRKIILLAAAPFLLAACSSDDNGPDSGDTRVPLRLTSGIEVQTRANNTQGTAIASGETVYAWVDDVTDDTERSVSPLYEANELTAKDDGSFSYTTAMYFPATGHDVDIYAIHGKIETGNTPLKEFPSTDGLIYSVNQDQSEGGGTGYTNSDLLYAVKQDVVRTATAVPLTFYHMLSKIELAIKVGNGSPALATSTGAVKLNNVTLNGKFTPAKTGDIEDQSTRANMLGKLDSPKMGDMTLGQETCTDFSANLVFNEAIVVPQDMSGKTLTFSLADGGTLTYTIPANTTFESGKKYIYLITLDLTGLTVTSTVADWETGTTSTGSATM